MVSEHEPRGVGSTGHASASSCTEVLLEAPEGAEAAVLWGVLDDAGYRVSWCPGPEGPPAAWCPLLGGCRCSLVASADVVVFALGLDNASCRHVLKEMGRLHPEMAVIVEAHPSEAAQWGTLLQNHTVLSAPPSRRSVLEALDTSVSHNRRVVSARRQGLE